MFSQFFSLLPCRLERRVRSPTAQKQRALLPSPHTPPPASLLLLAFVRQRASSAPRRRLLGQLLLRCWRFLHVKVVLLILATVLVKSSPRRRSAPRRRRVSRMRRRMLSLVRNCRPQPMESLRLPWWLPVRLCPPPRQSSVLARRLGGQDFTRAPSTSHSSGIFIICQVRCRSGCGVGCSRFAH